ncbi:hypothetical protein RRG08_002690 [Elysia crispata]|uniref:Uncharacterized protein n=1 Tax=Elysia crispata TaxID=231223 RepID=A0AAE1CMB0_9GAST|nr:hypothetical protein RRG08_002690 [Elysia crispata]
MSKAGNTGNRLYWTGRKQGKETQDVTNHPGLVQFAIGDCFSGKTHYTGYPWLGQFTTGSCFSWWPH